MKVTIIGKGNVGTHLFQALKQNNTDADIRLIDSRTLKGLNDQSDLIILAVPDRYIPQVAEHLYKKLNSYDGIVVHTGGSVNIEVLKNFFKNYGVLYPLQTFNKDIPIFNYAEIPIFIEGNNNISTEKIKRIGQSVSDNVIVLNSEKREKLHLASVFVCNFVNAMYIGAEKLLKDEKLSFQFVHSLLKETSRKAIILSPAQCQTGPASRGDIATIEKHLNLLDSNPELQSIYQQISSYIIEKYKKPEK